MKFQRMSVASVVAIGLLIRVAPVVAHHSAAEAYDATKKVEAQGTVTRVLLKNPHSFVFLQATDENGQKVEWQIEMGAWSGMVTNGWTQEMLAPGTVLKVSGIPSRAPGSHGMSTAKFTKADGSPVGPGGTGYDVK
jgi:hypothetical protein